MAIEIHCPACSKGIRAPDDAGGKRGKCPYCGASVYIPMPAAEVEDIPLAPVDPRAERERERLRQESILYAAQVDHDEPPKYDVGASARSAGVSGAAPRGRERSAADDEPIDVHDLVQKFVLAMRDSNLVEADRIAGRLRRRREQTDEYVQGLLLDQMGLSVKGVPQAVVNGFLKNLLERIA